MRKTNAPTEKPAQTAESAAHFHHARRSEYRPEIDGLRTIAVIPVILFHAGLQEFRGGFVGVDVFFVLSGFLLTGIIARELERGTFTIASFYERRVRRILPALFAVLIFCLVAGLALLLPEQLKKLGKAVI